MTEKFERHLRESNLSENTVASYLFAVKQYQEQYDKVTQRNLKAYKVWLIESYSPKTVNLRLRAMNCYLESIGKAEWKLPFVRVQQKAFLENVISEADYTYFKNCLKRDGEMFWYFVIRFLAATGARVSELIQIKVEHVRLGHIDLYSKGGKLRRIYIPKALQDEALSWLAEKKQESGFIFLTSTGIGLRPEASPVSSRSLPCAITSTRLWSTRTLSGTVSQRAFWSAATILLFLPISWDMKASRPRASISARRPRNSGRLWIT